MFDQYSRMSDGYSCFMDIDLGSETFVKCLRRYDRD